MITAYKKESLNAIENYSTAKTLQKDGYIKPDVSLTEIETEAGFFHPGWFMRILLFVVGFLAYSGLVGLWFLMAENAINNSYESFLLLTGILGLAIFEVLVIRRLKHYKSGLTEAVLYSSLGMIIGSMVELLENDIALGLLVSAMILSVAAIRYIDKTLTAFAVACFAAFVVDLCFSVGGVLQQLIPFIVMIIFGVFYFLSRRLENKKALKVWLLPIQVWQTLSLILIYAGGNYFVVRELDRGLNDTYLEPGQNIAFAWLFYALTVLFPIVFLYFGIKLRDRILLWVGLLSAGFSVFTFKYYYSLGHPEITLTLSGTLVLGVAIYLLNKLKTPIQGITRDKLAATGIDALTAEGIFISQTVGGIAAKNQPDKLFGGGDFGGGGASGNVD